MLSAGLTVPAQTTVRESLLGITGEKDVLLTSYEQLQKMLDELKEGGMNSFFVTYQAAVKSENEGKAAEKLETENRFGGDSGFLALLAREDAVIAPQISVNTFERSGNGISFFFDTVRNLSNGQAELASFRISTFYPDKDKPVRYLVSASKLQERGESIVEKTKDDLQKNIAVRDLATVIYANYQKKNRESREECVAAAVESLKVLCEGFSEVSSAGANLYALPYLSRITEVPLSSSDYLLADEDIPFLSLIYGGFAELYSVSVNLSEEPQLSICDALSFGVIPSFTLFYDCELKLPETEGERFFGCRYESVKEDVLDLWKEYVGARERFSGRLTGHRILGEGLYLAEYEGGQVVINRTQKPAETEYGRVPAEGWLIVEEVQK